MALPVARHFIKASGAGGAIHTRKLPGNSRVTLIELMDSTGGYLSRAAEKEKLRTPSFARIIVAPIPTSSEPSNSPAVRSRNTKLISTACWRTATILSATCGSLATTVYSIDCRLLPGDAGSFRGGVGHPQRVQRRQARTENGRASRVTPRQLEEYRRDVKVRRLGVLFLDDGERLALIDDRGNVLEGPTLLSVFCTLVAQTKATARLALSVTAPSRLEVALQTNGAVVIRTKADARSLLTTAVEQAADLAGDDRGGFLFPEEMQNGFDAPFAFGKLPRSACTRREAA